MKRFLPILLFVAGIGLWGLLRPEPPTAEIRPPSGPHVDKALATLLGIRWPDLSGKPRGLEVAADRVRVINFWATWCVPCGAEMPHLEALYQANKQKGFVILSIAMDGPETVAQVGPTARRYGISFPVLLDEETRVVGVYNPKRTAPLSVLIDKKGQIARVRNGYNAGDEKLVEADVAALLSAK